MGLFSAFGDAMFAGKVAVCLLDLGIDTKKLDKATEAKLFEMEKTRRKDLSPHEMAALFAAGSWRIIPLSASLMRSTDPTALAEHIGIVGTTWHRSGKIKPEIMDWVYLMTGTSADTKPRTFGALDAAYKDLFLK